MLSLPVEPLGSDTAVSAECESQMIEMFVVLHQRKVRKIVTTLAGTWQSRFFKTRQCPVSPKHILYSIRTVSPNFPMSRKYSSYIMINHVFQDYLGWDWHGVWDPPVRIPGLELFRLFFKAWLMMLMHRL